MERKEETGTMHFTRELGRALTCLFRGRRRFTFWTLPPRC